MAENEGVQNPVRVTLSEDFTTNKLSLGERYWVGDDDYDDLPRKGILRKGEEYVVCADDRVVQHFLDGGDLIPVDDVPASFNDKLQNLPYVDGSHAETIEYDFESWDDFVENVDAEYLDTLEGIGASRAEQILEAVQGEQ